MTLAEKTNEREGEWSGEKESDESRESAGKAGAFKGVCACADHSIGRKLPVRGKACSSRQMPR